MCRVDVTTDSINHRLTTSRQFLKSVLPPSGESVTSCDSGADFGRTVGLWDPRSSISATHSTYATGVADGGGGSDSQAEEDNSSSIHSSTVRSVTAHDGKSSPVSLFQTRGAFTGGKHRLGAGVGRARDARCDDKVPFPSPSDYEISAQRRRRVTESIYSAAAASTRIYQQLRRVTRRAAVSSIEPLRRYGLFKQMRQAAKGLEGTVGDYFEYLERGGKYFNEKAAISLEALPDHIWVGFLHLVCFFHVYIHIKI